MVTASHNRVFDEIIDFIASIPTPNEILAFKPSANAQHRLEDLLLKKQEDLLTESERHELDQYMMVEHIMRIAKAKARRRLVV